MRRRKGGKSCFSELWNMGEGGGEGASPRAEPENFFLGVFNCTEVFLGKAGGGGGERNPSCLLLRSPNAPFLPLSSFFGLISSPPPPRLSWVPFFPYSGLHTYPTLRDPTSLFSSILLPYSSSFWTLCLLHGTEEGRRARKE